jgi:EAL domain-containing protein (putative c-di-GMP-specific phosphodiesterase class I)
MEQGKSLGVTESPLVDFDAICQKVRAAVEPARAHAVSLHDEHGEVLWLSESSMGPDEHNAVREALEAFSEVNGPAVLAHDLGDSRSAVLLRAINARRAFAGVVMVIVETRNIARDDKGAVKLMSPRLQRAVTDFANMRPDIGPMPALSLAPAQPAAPAAAASRSAASRSMAASTIEPLELSLADSVRIPKPAFAATTATTPAPAVVAGPGARATPVPVARAAPAKRPPQTISPEIDRLHAALRRSPIALHVQHLVPLSKGSQLKRYEVLLRSKSEDAPNAAPQAMLKAAVENGLGSMIDRRVVTELIGWLVHHPDVWQTHPVMFSVNLTSTALQDEHFIKFVELCLAKSSLPRAMIAFEVDVPTAVGLGDKITEIAIALHRLDCPVVLDDFGLRTECFELLRLPGVRYIKLAPEITAKMRSDKVCQAAITAVVQMARVLGMHTVAKRAESSAEQDWLTALGVDFIQSNSFSPSVPIDTLSKAPKPKT